MPGACKICSSKDWWIGRSANASPARTDVENRPHQVTVEVQAGLARLVDPPKELKKIAAAPCFKPRSNPAGFRECGGWARNNAPRVRLREIRNSESSSPFRVRSLAKNCDRNRRATNESASAIHSEKIPRV